MHILVLHILLIRFIYLGQSALRFRGNYADSNGENCFLLVGQAQEIGLRTALSHLLIMGSNVLYIIACNSH